MLKLEADAAAAEGSGAAGVTGRGEGPLPWVTRRLTAIPTTTTATTVIPPTSLRRFRRRLASSKRTWVSSGSARCVGVWMTVTRGLAVPYA